MLWKKWHSLLLFTLVRNLFKGLGSSPNSLFPFLIVLFQNAIVPKSLLYFENTDCILLVFKQHMQMPKVYDKADFGLQYNFKKFEFNELALVKS